MFKLHEILISWRSCDVQVTRDSVWGYHESSLEVSQDFRIPRFITLLLPNCLCDIIFTVSLYPRYIV